MAASRSLDAIAHIAELLGGTNLCVDWLYLWASSIMKLRRSGWWMPALTSASR